jgi:hypothetical protein
MGGAGPTLSHSIPIKKEARAELRRAWRENRTLGSMFAGFAIGGLLAVAAGFGSRGAASVLLRGEGAGFAAGEAKDGGDEGEGGECFHEFGVAMG